MAGVVVSTENVNWLEGLISEIYLKEYCDFIHSHVNPERAPGAVVLDIDTPHLSVQTKNNASGATRSVPAIFELKIIQYNISNYYKPVKKTEDRPTKRQGCHVIAQY